MQLSEAPRKFSWIGVKSTLNYTLATGRDTSKRYVRIGKVIKMCPDNLLKVDFYKETSPGVWTKDGSGSEDVSKKDIVVLTPPESTSTKKVQGKVYMFPLKIIAIITSYFSKT